MEHPRNPICKPARQQIPQRQLALFTVHIISTLKAAPSPMSVATSTSLFPVRIYQLFLPIVSFIQHLQDQDLRDIGEWLSPLNFKLNQIEIYKNRGEGTGQWFLDSMEFLEWRDGGPGTLWCPGMREMTLSISLSFSIPLTVSCRIAGTGKTVMTYESLNFDRITSTLIIAQIKCCKPSPNDLQRTARCCGSVHLLQL
jgi:hypothetical protein